MENNSWKEYKNITLNLKARENAIKASELFDSEIGRVIDLGCGSGADSLLFIKKGWKVIAVDIETSAITRLKENLSLEENKSLEIIESKFEDLKIPKVNLVNASFSIPFCNPKDFKSLWENIKNSILPNGRFSGVLFGDKDEWNKEFKNRTFHNTSDIERLFVDFKIEWIEEKEFDGFCMGEDGEKVKKHWHYFSIVAKKIRG